MHRTEQNGATLGNLYTEGNPALLIPATVVGAPEMNSLQEELINVLTAFGVTPLTTLTDTFDQVQLAIKEAIARGGRLAPIDFDLVNNQATFADVTGMPTVNRTVIRSFEFLYNILRRTDSSHVLETGRAFCTYDPETLSWRFSKVSVHDDAGTLFQMAVVAGDEFKLQYKTDNLAGASYAGNIRITDIKNIRL